MSSCGLLLLFMILGSCRSSNSKDSFIPLKNEIVCRTTDIRSVRDFHRLENCTVIEGNLHLAMISIPPTPHPQKAYFPLLREITGYLLVYYILNLHSLAQLFPNLVIIRGQQLLRQYALVIKETDFRAVGLLSLREISRGGVRLEHSPQLCYVASIDWEMVVRQKRGSSDGKGDRENETSSPILRLINTRTLCLDTCHNERHVSDKICPRHEKYPGRQLCWMTNQCQSVCSQKCRSVGLTCHMKDVDFCCHPECLGGCYGPTAYDCVACRQVLSEGQCTGKCPSGYFEFMQRRCVRREQCISTKYPPAFLRVLSGSSRNVDESEEYYSIYNNTCVEDCPSKHIRDPTTGECLPCGSHTNVSCLKKICSSVWINSVKSLESIQGCYSVEDLFISLHDVNDELNAQLVEAFSSLQVIEKSLRVVRSKNLHSLNFLRHLRRIGGVGLNNDVNVSKNGSFSESHPRNRSLPYQRRMENLAVEIVANEYLRELWTPSESNGPVRVEQGEIQIILNRHLCPNVIINFVNHTLSWHRAMTAAEYKDINRSNGDLVPCDYFPLTIQINGIYKAAVTLDLFPSQPINSSADDAMVQFYIRATKDNVTHYDNIHSCGKSKWRVYNRQYTQEGTYSINELNAATRYAVYSELKVLRTNVMALSTVIYFTTKTSNPSVPYMVKAKALSSTEVRVSWKPPLLPNGIVTKYFIWYRMLSLEKEAFHQKDICKTNAGREHVFTREYNAQQREQDVFSSLDTEMTQKLGHSNKSSPSSVGRFSLSRDNPSGRHQVLKEACKQCSAQCSSDFSSWNSFSRRKGDDSVPKLISLARRPVILANNTLWSLNNISTGSNVDARGQFNQDKSFCPLQHYSALATQQEQEDYGQFFHEIFVKTLIYRPVYPTVSSNGENPDKKSNASSPSTNKTSEPILNIPLNMSTKIPAALTTTPYASMQRIEVTAERLSYIITNLQHYTEYSIEVQACQSVGKTHMDILEEKRRMFLNITDLSMPAMLQYYDDISQGEPQYCSDLVLVAVKTMSNYSKDAIDESRISVDVTNQHVRILWPAPANPNGVILNYQLRHRQMFHESKRSSPWTTQCVTLENWRVAGCSRMARDLECDPEIGGALLYHTPGQYEFQISTRTLAHNDTWTGIHTFIVDPTLSRSEKVLRTILVVLVLSFILLIGIIITAHWFRKRKLTKSLWVSQNPTYCDLYEIDAWELEYKDLDTLNWSYPLGKGSFGLVYRGVLRRLTTPAQKVFGEGVQNIPVAIKTLSESRNPYRRRDFINEACYMKQCCSTHIVQLLGVVSKIPDKGKVEEKSWRRFFIGIWQWIKDVARNIRMNIVSYFRRICGVNGTLKGGLLHSTPSLKARNLAPFKGPNFASRMDDSPLIVMEFMPLGDLAGYLRRLGDEGVGSVNAAQALLWAAQVADGMAFLEDNVLVHRDLAARNCMIDQNLVVKIGDFGLARDIKERLYYRKKGIGEMPIRWMSPEAIKTGTSTHKSDVWAYGVVLWEITMFASLPYRGMSQQEVATYVTEGYTLFSNGIPAKCHSLMSDLMTSCWAYNPLARPNFLQILEKLEPFTDAEFVARSFYHNRTLTQSSREMSGRLDQSEFSSCLSDDNVAQYMPQWNIVPSSPNMSEECHDSLVRKWTEKHCFTNDVDVQDSYQAELMAPLFSSEPQLHRMSTGTSSKPSVTDQ